MSVIFQRTVRSTDKIFKNFLFWKICGFDFWTIYTLYAYQLPYKQLYIIVWLMMCLILCSQLKEYIDDTEDFINIQLVNISLTVVEILQFMCLYWELVLSGTSTYQTQSLAHDLTVTSLMLLELLESIGKKKDSAYSQSIPDSHLR